MQSLLESFENLTTFKHFGNDEQDAIIVKCFSELKALWITKISGCMNQKGTLNAIFVGKF